MVIVREFAGDPWALGKYAFPGSFLMVLVMGATTGFYFISPADGWVEMIIESLAISLTTTAVMVVGAGAYFRWKGR